MAANYEQPEDVVTRVRFFDGQYLQDQDFIDEQHYHSDRQRRHQRLLHVAGIAEGLTVTPVAGTVQVEVAPGTAIDADGRVIVVTDEPEADRVVNLADHLGRTVNLYVVYQEVETNPQATGAADFGRWLEKPLFEVVDAQRAHDFPHPPVMLARIELNNQGIERIDTAPVVYSGVRLPGPGSDAPTLRTVTGGTVELRAPLRVTGNTAVTGDATIDGSVRFGRSTRQMVNLWDANYGIGVQSSTQYFRTDFHFAWYQGGSHNNAELNPGGGTALMVLKGGNLGVGVSNPTSRLHVSGDVYSTGAITTGTGLGIGAVPSQPLTVFKAWNSGKDPDNGLTGAGAIAIKSEAPQIDFIDTNGNDWAIHVNSNKMYFIREPWNHTDLVLDGAGNVGVGTATPGAKLHVAGNTQVAGTLGVNQVSVQPLTVYQADWNGAPIDSESKLANGGALAIKSNAPQLDFVETNGTDWAIHLNSGLLRFVSEPWNDANLVLDPGGAIGIGTLTPRQRLTVAGNTGSGKDADSALTEGGQIAIKGTAPQIDFIDTNGQDWAIHVNSNKMYFIREPWNHSDLVLDGAGNVGVGTTDPRSKLDVRGSLSVVGDRSEIIFTNNAASETWKIIPEWTFGSHNLVFWKDGTSRAWVQSYGGMGGLSDARLKEDIAPLGPVLGDVLRLRPSSFRFKDSPTDQPLIGFLAQDVGEIFPGLVDECDGYLGLRYDDFAVLAIAAIQEQQVAIAAFQQRLDALTDRVAGGETDGGASDDVATASTANEGSER